MKSAAWRWPRLVMMLLLVPLAARAADVPVHVQMPLFANILKLDRTFKPSGAVVTIAVLFQDRNAASSAAREEVFKWTQKTGSARAFGVAMDSATWKEVLTTAEADVYYVTPMRGIDIGQIAAIARKRQIRTMAALPEYVGQGLNVAIGVRNDRPLIIINLAAARAEGATYQAQLLKLAEIVNR